MNHALGTLLREAAAGRFPEPDGGWRRVPPWQHGVEAVVAFTGHAVVCVDEGVDDVWLGSLGIDGVGGAHHPRVLTALAGSDGEIDCLDGVLSALGRGGASAVPERRDLADHPRARHARSWRTDVRTYGDERGLLTVGTGIGGLPELSLEVAPHRRCAGAGRSLLVDALTLVPAGESVLAAVAPGNAASLRAMLAAGFRPVGSVQLYRPAHRQPG